MTCDFFTEKVFLNEKGCGTLEFHILVGYAGHGIYLDSESLLWGL